ncbi:hypothetical protein ACFL41_02740 [Gemmatimonadota bacterium]
MNILFNTMTDSLGKYRIEGDRETPGDLVGVRLKFVKSGFTLIEILDVPYYSYSYNYSDNIPDTIDVQMEPITP